MTNDVHKLLLATHRGHEPSAERLWALFAPRLLAYAAAVLPSGQRHAADDVVQHVFCSVLDRPRRELKAVNDVTAWMFCATRNAALNHARTERREHDRREQLRVDSHGLPDRSIPESVDRLVAAADTLPPEQRETLLLRLVGGLTLEQTAAALGENRNTLASRYRAAVQAIRAATQDESTGELEAEHV